MSEYLYNVHMIDANMLPAEPQYTTSCLICGEAIPIWDFGGSPIKICEECKAAVMKMREQMEATDAGNKTD